MSSTRKLLYRGSLYACFTILTGCSLAPFLPFPVSIKDIPWGEPKDLSLNNCPNINGMYRATPVGSADISFVLYNLFSAPSEKIIFTNHAPSEHAKSKAREDQLAFAQTQLVSIYIDNNALSSTEFNTLGNRFVSRTVNFSSTVDPADHNRGQEWRVGCLAGSYITRNVYSSGSNEGSGKQRSWREKRIRKLPDENIEIHITSCSYPQFREPRCGSYITIFPVYNEN